MNRFALLNFKIFWGQCPQISILGRGYGAPPQSPPSSALRRFAPPCLARGLRPLHRPSLCVVDILRYFRPWLQCFNVQANTVINTGEATRKRILEPIAESCNMKTVPVLQTGRIRIVQLQVNYAD